MELQAGASYLAKYDGTTIVIKYGGAVMLDAELEDAFARDMVQLKQAGIRIVLVHGGGKEITEIASRLGVSTRFIHGQRYTDAAMMQVVQMVLAGKTNKDIVARINCHHGNALGLCGIDLNLLRVRTMSGEEGDLGFVGEIVSVNANQLRLFLDHDMLPVIAPVGIDAGGQAHNINADVAAAHLASALMA